MRLIRLQNMVWKKVRNQTAAMTLQKKKRLKINNAFIIIDESEAGFSKDTTRQKDSFRVKPLNYRSEMWLRA